MSKITLELEITQQDIDSSKDYGRKCALASAINRKLDLTGSIRFRSYASVNYDGIWIMKPDYVMSALWSHTPESKRFVELIDDNKSKVQPCKLTIYRDLSDDNNLRRVA